MPWILKSPKHYKRNIILGDLHGLKRILSNFNTEIRAIKNKYGNASYLICFIRSVIKNVNTSHEDDVSVIIPPYFCIMKFHIVKQMKQHQNISLNISVMALLRFEANIVDQSSYD